MNNQHRNRIGRLRCDGFTLVEMSVVLVIIALLVGGIASLRSYTRNAAIFSLMNEAKIYINAFNRFQTQYGTPPGDYATASAAWSGTSNGDGNGLVRATSTAGSGNRDELYYTFQHLAKAGFITGTYTGLGTGGAGNYDAKIGTNVPRTNMPQVTFLFDGPDYADGVPDGFVSGNALFFDGQYTNVIRIAGHNDTETGLPDNGFLTPKDALKVDEKYDDGMPATGIIATVKQSALAGCANGDTTAALYDTAQDAKNCWLLQKIQ